MAFAVTKLAYLSFLLFLTEAICLEAKSPGLKKTEMVLYMHDWANATKESNVTSIIVAGNPKTQANNVLTYGTVIVIDDALTLGIERNSTEIGRARGMYINSALDGSDLHLLFSLVFTNKKYNGSTIQIQGSDRYLLKYRDVSVVGGTGAFRMASGWATLETAFLDVPNLNAIIEFNLTVYHF